jgi:hypothetical protein
MPKRFGLHLEKDTKDALAKQLPHGFQLGSAIGRGDCFFDAFAKALNQAQSRNWHTAQSARHDCWMFANEALKNRDRKVRQLVENDRSGEYSTLEEYIARIQYTASNIYGEYKQVCKILKLKYPIWGRPEIEGRMLCKKYSAHLYLYEIREIEQPDIPKILMQRINKTGSVPVTSVTKVQEKICKLSGFLSIHIVTASGQNHFVPALKSDPISSKPALHKHGTALPCRDFLKAQWITIYPFLQSGGRRVVDSVSEKLLKIMRLGPSITTGGLLLLMMTSVGMLLAVVSLPSESRIKMGNFLMDYPFFISVALLALGILVEISTDIFFWPSEPAPSGVSVLKSAPRL